jgi:hypothetical protein
MLRNFSITDLATSLRLRAEVVIMHMLISPSSGGAGV